MQTFKKLGFRMHRGTTGMWYVNDGQNGRVLYEGTGNKGMVMSAALERLRELGIVEFANKEWRRVNTQY